MSDHRFTAIGPVGAQSAPFLGSRGFFYELETDLANILKFYWNVKTWSLSSDFSATAGGHTAQFDTGNVGGTDAVVEKTLAWPGAQCTWSLLVTSGPGVSGSGSGVMFAGAAPPNYLLYATDPPDVYRPWISIAGSLLADDSDVHDPVQNQVILAFQSNKQVFIDAGITPDGTVNASIGGFTLPLYYKETLVIGSGSTNATSLSITPLSYWPYEVAGGGPKYNTSTGAKL